MYSIGFNHGRKAATKDIVEAIDDFLKYDYPDNDDDFVHGMKKARDIVKDWGLTMAENKMEAIAQLFGKKLNERFTVRYDGNHLFDCKFTECGLISYGAYENPWLDFDTFMLQDLLVGKAVIVDEDRR